MDQSQPNTTVPPLIQFTDVQLAYQKQVVLRDLNVKIAKGEFVYLIGRTGSGKSTFLKALYADALPVHGTLVVDKFQLHNVKKGEIPLLRRRLGIVFQDFQLLTDRTIGENMLFVMKATGWSDKKRMKEHLNEVLMKVGLSTKINFMPHQLSGGEQQRAAIARAIINDPILIVSDEPTGNLDPEVSDHIIELFHKINQSGTAIVLATHDYEIIRKYPARVLECTDHTVRNKSMPQNG